MNSQNKKNYEIMKSFKMYLFHFRLQFIDSKIEAHFRLQFIGVRLIVKCKM